MTMLFSTNTRIALQSIRANKTRSLLTMLGIIIGVASVIMTVALGEGFRRQVVQTNQSNNPDLVTIRPGKVATRDDSGTITHINYLASFGANSLTDKDYESLQKLTEAAAVVPLSTISGLATNFEGQEYTDGVVIASTERLPEMLGQKVAYGSFFRDDSNGRNVVIIGRRVAEELYKENVPLGKLMTIRGKDFVIGGIFEEFQTNPLSAVTDLNKGIFMSYPLAKEIVGGNPSIYQFMLTPTTEHTSAQLAAAAHETLLANHGRQEDFTVLRAEETEFIAQDTARTATAFVVGIAAISLLVGGIGIMNIMFVAVTERTREIGVRKSLGATNRQIYTQFMIEATVMSIVGGIVGVILAFGGIAALRIISSLQPAVTWQIIALAVGASATVGIIFGTAPAVKAARKDPIEALRYE